MAKIFTTLPALFNKPRKLLEILRGPSKTPVWKSKYTQWNILNYFKKYFTDITRNVDPIEWDFVQIRDITRTDSYTARAMRRHRRNMFKGGLSLISKRKNAADKINAKLRLISLMSGLPTKFLFFEAATNLVLYMNSFIIIVRDPVKGPNAATRTYRDIFGKTTGMIRGLYPISPIYIKPTLEKGRLVNWKYFYASDRSSYNINLLTDYSQYTYGSIPLSGEYIELDPADVVHIRGPLDDETDIFSTPMQVPVFDDIKLLRETEGNIAQLIEDYLHVMLHAKKGNEQTWKVIDQPEINALQIDLNNLSKHGSIATAWDVDINPVGPGARDIIPYADFLKHMKSRVYSGLDMNNKAMGESDSSNRSTADSLTQDEIDVAKELQFLFAIWIDTLFMGLLQELGVNILDPDNDVYAQFGEIDLINKIKAEQHIATMFGYNLITHTEARLLLGKEEMSAEEIAETQFNLFPGKQSAEGTADNTVRPANQHGKLLGPHKKRS